MQTNFRNVGTSTSTSMDLSKTPSSTGLGTNERKHTTQMWETRTKNSHGAPKYGHFILPLPVCWKSIPKSNTHLLSRNPDCERSPKSDWSLFVDTEPQSVVQKVCSLIHDDLLPVWMRWCAEEIGESESKKVVQWQAIGQFLFGCTDQPKKFTYISFSCWWLIIALHHIICVFK